MFPHSVLVKVVDRHKIDNLHQLNIGMRGEGESSPVVDDMEFYVPAPLPISLVYNILLITDTPFYKMLMVYVHIYLEMT